MVVPPEARPTTVASTLTTCVRTAECSSIRTSGGSILVAQAHISYPADGVGLVLIDNPPRNFASWALIERIEEAVYNVRDSGARVVVLASDVPGYFICHAW